MVVCGVVCGGGCCVGCVLNSCLCGVWLCDICIVMLGLVCVPLLLLCSVWAVGPLAVCSVGFLGVEDQWLCVCCG